MNRSAAHVVNAYLDKIAHADVLMVQCRDKLGSCSVYLDILDGGNYTGIVGIQGDSLKGFPREGASLMDVLRWVRTGRHRSVCHPSKGWITNPDLNDFYYLQLRA